MPQKQKQATNACYNAVGSGHPPVLQRICNWLFNSVKLDTEIDADATETEKKK